MPPRVVVPRWIQLVLLPIALLAAYVVVKAGSKVVMIFVVASIIALILNPARRPRSRACAFPAGWRC